MTMYKLVEYVWLDGKGNLRSKVRVLYGKYDDIPIWDYDGSSTDQATREHSEVSLYPVYVVPCPFRRGNAVIALCETYIDGKPTESNTRASASEIFRKYEKHEPWYGLEQEYYLLLGDPTGSHYCTVGNAHRLARLISETHLQHCLYAGLFMSGTNAEVALNQWEFQIGPQVGIHAADQLVLARFILLKLCESHGVGVTFDPKPYPDLSGSGCHTNFSTKVMREDGGYSVIAKTIGRLAKTHAEYISSYGEGNERRMTGEHETATYDKFTWGVGNRSASVRVNSTTYANKKGYFEDRRPAANADPYTVTSLLLRAAIAD